MDDNFTTLFLGRKSPEVAGFGFAGGRQFRIYWLREALMRMRFKPAVDKLWLVLLAGVMWTGVGIMLCAMATRWLVGGPRNLALPFGALGVVLGIATYRFGFTSLAQKNIHRIHLYTGRVCLFAFQRWQSYWLIAAMITLGRTLRHSSFPKHYLAVIYLTMGLALFISSLSYYRAFRRTDGFVDAGQRSPGRSG